jgi:hypothetical protein
MAVAMASMMGPSPTIEVPEMIIAPAPVVASEVVTQIPEVAKAEIVITSPGPFDLQAI